MTHTTNTIYTGGLVNTISTASSTATISSPAPSFVRPIEPNKPSFKMTKDMVSNSADIKIHIKNIKLLPDENNPRVVIMEFYDGSVEKAVTAKNDTFDLETGLSICVMKKILSAITGTNNGTKLYNNLIKQAIQRFNKIKKERETLEIQKLVIERQKQKKIQKKNAKKERKRKESILAQKEAYIQAMLELKAITGDDGK